MIFTSKDKGKSYQEVIFPEENVTNLTLSEKYSLVETNSRGYSPMGKNVIYLLDNSTLQYKNIYEYPSINKINYSQFNGEYVICSNGSVKKLLNIFTKEEYDLPNDVVENNFILNNSGPSITFLKEKNKIVVFNAKRNTYGLAKELKDSYTTIMSTFGDTYLGKINLLKTSGEIYDLNENRLFEISFKEERGRYRYKHFVCEVTQHMPKFTIKYSYNYGKTWKEYSTEDFFISSSPIGYYKDKYVVYGVPRF